MTAILRLQLDDKDPVRVNSAINQLAEFSDRNVFRMPVPSGGMSFYVRTDGNDSNNGLANSSSGAFLTMQKAYDTICSKYDLAGQPVTIQVGAATYSAGILFDKSWTGGGSITVNGDTTTPSNVIINSSTHCFRITCTLPAFLTIQGFKVTTSAGHGIYNSGVGTVQYGRMEFGVMPSTGNHVTVDAPGALVSGIAGYTISGGAQAHWYSTLYGAIKVFTPQTITLAGTLTFTLGFACDEAAGLIAVGPNGVVNFSWIAAIGPRYVVPAGSLIDTFGSGTSYFPGNAAGSGAGIYL